MNKKIISVLLSVTMTLSVFIPSVSQASSVPSSWAANEVNEAVSEGLITDSVSRDYQADITREQFCEMVILAYEKISGNTAQTGSYSFYDTDNNEVLKAANLGIVTGYGNGSFGPDDLITREQIAAMLVRMIDVAVPYANVNIYNNNHFADDSAISDWALPSVNFAYDNELMQGVGDNKIDPLANTTCEQAVLLIYRAYNRYSNGSNIIVEPNINYKINDHEDALNVINDVSDEIGISSVDKEIIYEGRHNVFDNEFYTFQQVYNDIPVYGRSITLVVDSEGYCAVLSENYLYLDINTEINVKKEDVYKYINKLYEDRIKNIFVEDLVVYSLSNIEPQVCWKVYISTRDDISEYLFVSATTGNVIANSALEYYDTVRASGMDLDGNMCSFNTYTEDYAKYFMEDRDENIILYDAENGTLSAIAVVADENNNIYKPNDDGTAWIDKKNKVVEIESNDMGRYTILDDEGNKISEYGETAWYLFIDSNIVDGLTWGMWDNSNIFASLTLPSNKSTVWDNKKAVTLISRLEKLNLFYSEIFHVDGYDGNNGAIIAVINDNKNGDITNAYSKGDLNGQTILSFGTASSLSYDLIGHEYRHSVTSSIRDGLEYKSESGALNEAYSDIFGELFEDWVDDNELNNSCDWIHNNGRNLSHPFRTNNPNLYRGDYWADTSNLDNDNGGVHQNSTVISYSAYLMVEGLNKNDSIEYLTNTQLAELFYTTSYLLTYTCTFDEFAKALYTVGNLMCMEGEISLEQLQCIANSLEEVGLSITDQSISGKIVSDSGKTVENALISFSMNNVIICFAETNMYGDFSAKLPVGVYDIRISKEGYESTMLDANLNINENFVFAEDIIIKENMSDEEKLLNAFIRQEGGDYLYFLPGDYDNDDTIEAFVITGKEADDMGIHSDVDIWFVNSEGQCAEAKTGIYGILKESITVSNGSFITWCVTAGGSGTSTIVLGCKNGELFEPEISERYAGFGDRTMNYLFSDVNDFDKLNCDYIGYYSYFKDGGGHIWDPIPFDYDASTREFTINSDNGISYEKILTGDFSDISGVWRNTQGNTIILQDNGMDSSDRSNDKLEFAVENIKKENNNSYSWSIISYYNGKAVDGYGFVLYPVGVDVISWDGMVVNTDTSKIRLWSGNGSISTDQSDVIYYKE